MGKEGGREQERVETMASRQAGREDDKMAEERSSCGGGGGGGGFRVIKTDRRTDGQRGNKKRWGVGGGGRDQ